MSAADLVWPFDVAFFEDDTNPGDGRAVRLAYPCRKETYNPFNKWTTTDRGTLRVGGGASVQRRDGNGQAVVDP